MNQLGGNKLVHRKLEVRERSLTKPNVFRLFWSRTKSAGFCFAPYVTAVFRIWADLGIAQEEVIGHPSSLTAKPWDAFRLSVFPSTYGLYLFENWVIQLVFKWAFPLNSLLHCRLTTGFPYTTDHFICNGDEGHSFSLWLVDYACSFSAGWLIFILISQSTLSRNLLNLYFLPFRLNSVLD